MPCYLLERQCFGSMRNQAGCLLRGMSGSGRSIKAVMRLFLKKAYPACHLQGERKEHVFETNTVAQLDIMKSFLPTASGGYWYAIGM